MTGNISIATICLAFVGAIVVAAANLRVTDTRYW
jgi:hypothetical protein